MSGPELRAVDVNEELTNDVKAEDPGTDIWNLEARGKREAMKDLLGFIVGVLAITVGE